jgi:hypothetical protein
MLCDEAPMPAVTAAEGCDPGDRTINCGAGFLLH